MTALAYSVVVGLGGQNSSFAGIVSISGGSGSRNSPGSGGSGGGRSFTSPGGAGTTGQGVRRRRRLNWRLGGWRWWRRWRPRTKLIRINNSGHWWRGRLRGHKLNHWHSCSPWRRRWRRRLRHPRWRRDGNGWRRRRGRECKWLTRHPQHGRRRGWGWQRWHWRSWRIRHRHHPVSDLTHHGPGQQASQCSYNCWTHLPSDFIAAFEAATSSLLEPGLLSLATRYTSLFCTFYCYLWHC
jgi:hypothetical protein